MDRQSLPLWVSTHPANLREVTRVQMSFDFHLLKAKPEHLIGDRAYDSDPLDAAMAEKGVNLISPHRNNRKAQDGRSYVLRASPVGGAVLRAACRHNSTAQTNLR